MLCARGSVSVYVCDVRMRARVPLHYVDAGDPVVAPQGDQAAVHLQQTHSSAGGTEGGHISAPGVGPWVVPEGAAGRGGVK